VVKANKSLGLLGEINRSLPGGFVSHWESNTKKLPVYFGGIKVDSIAVRIVAKKVIY
jgi:hypothetical protein